MSKQDNLKKIGRLLLFPHTAIIFLCFNITLAGLIYIFMNNLQESIVASIFYAFCFYTLVIVCIKIPGMVQKAKQTLHSNQYTHQYLTDRELRMHISIYKGLLINIPFALFKIIMGVMFQSAWLFAMAGYHTILSIMRCLMVYRHYHRKENIPEIERRKKELLSYRMCGWLMIILNIAISVIVAMVIVENQQIVYPGFMVIGIATFTFYCLTMAIINIIKYHKLTNPVYSAVKRIELAKALVSLFTMQVALISQYGDASGFNARLMNGLTGAAICILINVMAVMMLVGGRRNYREALNNEQQQ